MAAPKSEPTVFVGIVLDFENRGFRPTKRSLYPNRYESGTPRYMGGYRHLHELYLPL